MSLLVKSLVGHAAMDKTKPDASEIHTRGTVVVCSIVWHIIKSMKAR